MSHRDDDEEMDEGMLQQLLDDLRGARDTPQLVYSTAGDWNVCFPCAFWCHLCTLFQSMWNPLNYVRA
jgi:hypothetical protein